MKYLVLFFFFFSSLSYGDTRTNDLPQGFKWRYIIDEKEPTPRSGQFWRSGVILSDRLIVLNIHMLIALDFQGKELWKIGLQAENLSAEAKIHQISSNEIILVTTDTLLRISTDTGELLESFNHDVRRRAAFQFTELMPRHSIFFDKELYVFLGPQLLAFDQENLTKKEVFNFNSSPKTIPILYKDKFVLSFVNGFVELFDPYKKETSTLISGDPSKNFSIRQPIVQEEFIYIPMNNRLEVYQDTNFYARSTQLSNSILTSLEGKVWRRSHQSGLIQEIDPTLGPIREVQFIADKFANSITAPLVGNKKTLIHVDGIDGQLFIISYDDSNNIALQKHLYSEEFRDNPPLQALDQKDNHLLLGGFEGLYLINLDEL